MVATYKTYPHGTHASYTLNRCRCEPCRDANRRYEQKRTIDHIMGRQPLVDPKEARAHVRKLMRQGMGYKRIAEVAGLNPKVVYVLWSGKRKGRSAKKIRRETAEKVLAVTLDYAGGAKVPKAEAMAIIAELVARGWTKAAIARQVTSNPNAWALQVGKGELVFAGKLVKLRELLDEPVPLRVYTRGAAGPKLMAPTKARKPRPVRASTVGVTTNGDQASGPETIADLMRDGAWWTMLRLVFESPAGSEATRRAVYRLVEAGKVEKRPAQRSLREFEYRLVDR